MLFAAIDVGTNSIHLIVVEIDSSFDTSRVIYKAREMVRLGSNDALANGELSAKAMTRGVDAIARFVDAARSRGAERIRAVATSAVREAGNAATFVSMVAAQTGIALEVLDEREEARLIHLGAARGYPIYDRLACIVDIGGGSTEFIVADGERPYLLESVKLGSLRIYDQFMRGAKDPQKAERAMNRHIASLLDPLAPQLRNFRIDFGIGTSGTIMGLAALDAADRGAPLARVHGYTIELRRLRDLQKRMLAMSEDERRKMPGMNPRRADIIVAGNAILIGALTVLGLSEIVVCERALRDGIIVDLVQTDRVIAERLGDERVRRFEEVDNLALRFEAYGVHQRAVARIANQLFERLADVHGLAPGDRDLLYAAAVAHSVGGFIANSSQHKHTAYIVRNSLLRGWRDDERELIATLARYYRKAMPKPSHPEFAALSALDQQRISKLASLLRIADGLDSRHLGLVSGINVIRESGRIRVLAQADQDITSELGAATYKADLFARTFGLDIAFEADREPA